MNEIELVQRKIIIKGKTTYSFESSHDILTKFNSLPLSESDAIILGIYSLGLTYMEGKSDDDITTYANTISEHSPLLKKLCLRVLEKATSSNNRIENALTEAIKIAEEIKSHHE